ncbi:arylsulfatase [Myriangium duriaei CBS 260.36]|uniref:Arylsulfatase n=1 Tax=Myriangium duriaei CBS 260.36 TaxID=1168546 RepID=A0A9P4MHH2_9PEZI|nr:arylsulfatase [Myriangium duriaei CBS 260.36]
MGRPNFLVIVADDLGFSDVSCFGSEIKTPNIDRLAASGVRFTDFHAASACSPTRSMLMSGTDHHIAGVGAMAENANEFQRGKAGYEGYLHDRVAPLPALLRNAGYKTYMAGKWHLGLAKGQWPVDRGFDRSYSLLPGAANHYGYEPQLRPGDKLPKLLHETNVFYVEDNQKIEPHELGPDFYSTDAFASKMVSFLSERTSEDKESPFFAYLPFSAPHWPLQAPDEDIAAYKGTYDAGPEALRQARVAALKKLGLVPEHTVPHDVIAPHSGLMSKKWSDLSPSEKQFSSRAMEVYAAMVSHMDTAIGRVLTHLESTGELDNTFVLFMSDNGAEGSLLESIPIINENIFEHIEKYYNNSIENVGRHDSYVWYGPHWASAGTAPGRLYKCFTAEGGIRVPLIVSYPGFKEGRPGGSIDHGFTTVMDVLPTLLQLAGTKHPGTTYEGREVAPVRGKSWVEYLSTRDPVTPVHEEDTVTGWELFGRLAVRKGKWKATFIPQPYGPEKWQLFDLHADSGETNDLAEQHRDKLKELLEAWADYMKECGVVGSAPEYGTLIVD